MRETSRSRRLPRCRAARRLRFTTSNIAIRVKNLESILTEKPRSGKPAVITGEMKARITALACSAAPAGHARWTLQLLADKAVEFGLVDSISYKTCGEILKKRASTAVEEDVVHRNDNERISGADGRCVLALQSAARSTSPGDLCG